MAQRRAGKKVDQREIHSDVTTVGKTVFRMVEMKGRELVGLKEAKWVASTAEHLDVRSVVKRVARTADPTGD